MRDSQLGRLQAGVSNADDSFLAESVPRLGADFLVVDTAEQAGYDLTVVKSLDELNTLLGI